MASQLALFGGPKAVTMEPEDNWKRIGQEEIDLVVEMMEREEISSAGTGVMGEFERNFADYHGAKYCLSQNNGTSTLHCAYFAAGVGPGDEVILPAYTWGNMVRPVLFTNGIPVFCEIDPHTLTADPADIRKKITPRTKAISVVHVWGNVADMDAIMEIANEHNLIVIEDCSHAHGGEYKGRKVGTLGHIGCFSLQGGKTVTAGEGGAIITNDTELYERILICGHQGRVARDLVTDKYAFLGYMGLGFKYRAHPLAMGIAKVQLSKLDKLNEQRTKIFRYIDAGLGAIPGIEIPAVLPGVNRGGLFEHRWIMHPGKLGGVSRDRFVEALQAEGVPCCEDRYELQHLEPLYQYDFYGHGCPFHCPHVTENRVYKKGDLPITEEVHGRLIAMRVFTDPVDGLLDGIIEAFRKVAANANELL